MASIPNNSTGLFIRRYNQPRVEIKISATHGENANTLVISKNELIHQLDKDIFQILEDNKILRRKIEATGVYVYNAGVPYIRDPEVRYRYFYTSIFENEVIDMINSIYLMATTKFVEIVNKYPNWTENQIIDRLVEELKPIYKLKKDVIYQQYGRDWKEFRQLHMKK